MRKKMMDAARKNHPTEACGVLCGYIDNEKAIVKKVVETENSADNPSVGFYIDPELFYNILISAEEQGLEFIGIFHSHPARPNPSSWDLEYMKLHQNVWIIIQSEGGGKKTQMKAFQWYNEKLFEVKIIIA
jgi:proteasome lid subunit RPN8/RPN11